ncbi:TPA: TonB-dependent hemoglobin/transferrin/lactoferrin family receptor [Pasteurella multocida]|nr:TonB-dependent hemoglobin/transferrin/lactoferrin family receptor [Pasteurella multocida]MEB3467787.1 TonB-dependent hemoglobin/transferrin/lactoferrin family receptor [Pasteurella multocida]URJ92487.1 TonB-dependent hemoglobin/transferrin/lactoferrin family receptor [Pasteurella multocida]HDR1604531.1 TonB-dependent hemoglobin/transferrin/lactoferrin family receptor [Pasteurella multocida]HDR1797801.1 TonB-dependent hemoglobin/transferrin/lactoferrin family receptor [Pasteurella multocida]
MRTTTIKFSAITLALLSYCGVILADSHQETTELDTITVSSQQDEINIKEKKVGETVKTASQLKRQQVQDSRDLVRYETGVTVVEAGRFGSSGYAIRGVDENRVAITVDGLHQAETLSSQGFKELFEGYGNFNNTRNSVEIETLKQASINKGASSVKTGSGALGGAVIFETKDARDLLVEKDWHLSYKKGYNTADNQELNTFTIAGRYKGFDALIVRTERRGYETENFGYKSYNDRVQGKRREKADPYRRTQESTLLKFGFQPNENHRFVVMADLYETRSRGHDFSYSLKPNTIHHTYDEVELRHTNDSNRRTNYAFSYENFSANPFYDTLKVTYSDQKIRARARTDDFCDGNELCLALSNPLGIRYNDQNRLVGKDGKQANYIKVEGKTFRGYYKIYEVTNDELEKLPKWARKNPIRYMMNAKKDILFSEENITKLNQYARNNGFSEIVDSKGIKCVTRQDELDNNGQSTGTSNATKPNECIISLSGNREAKKEFNVNDQTYDMSIAENNNKISIDKARGAQLFKCNNESGISCDVVNKKIEGINWRTGEKVEIPFEIVEINGEKFAKTKANQDQSVIVPNAAGYNQNLWSQRDLITHTKQVNLDLSKYLELGKTQHNLAYGGLWSETKKEMINRTGSASLDIQWWALYKDCGDPQCTKTDTFSFLIPVKADTGAIYFNDDFKVNDYLSFGLGYRYDRIKYKPHYTPGTTPKIPDDMVTNLYVSEPAFDPNDLMGEENRLKREANANANIKYIAQPKKYSASSYNLNVTVDPLNWLRLQAKYSKGFRAPTGEEIYFTFKHPDFSIKPNRDLEEETAKTKELAMMLYNDYGFITVSGFETKYKNFIDLMYLGPKALQGRSALTRFETWQNVNRDEAKVTGIEISSKFNLAAVWDKLRDFNMSYKFSYQKGRVKVKETVLQAPPQNATGIEALTYKTLGEVETTVPMNAIQPQTHVIGLGYNHNSGKFGFDLFVTHATAKKAKDTYNMFWQAQRAEDVAKYPKEEDRVVKDNKQRWRSNAYTLFDVIAYAKPIKNVTLQFGVYNLTNKKYLTWDSARSIRPFGTSNMIDQRTGAGINRFNAPGRNYKLSAEITF